MHTVTPDARCTVAYVTVWVGLSELTVMNATGVHVSTTQLAWHCTQDNSHWRSLRPVIVRNYFITVNSTRLAPVFWRPPATGTHTSRVIRETFWKFFLKTGLEILENFAKFYFFSVEKVSSDICRRDMRVHTVIVCRFNTDTVTAHHVRRYFRPSIGPTGRCPHPLLPPGLSRCTFVSKLSFVEYS